MSLNGLFSPSAWQVVLIILVLTHVTIVSVTVYLHRHSAHRALDLHPALAHFFRFWLWLSTATNTKEWTSIHRKHHAFCETGNDPHSPVIFGIGKVLREGAELYQAEARNQETLDRFGTGTPDDWVERNLYSRFPNLGIAFMGAINLVCFGPIGITIWAVQMMWIPVFAAGVINGIGHFWGYRNFECRDASRNIVPWGILIGGEELHNNHHTYPNSAKLSVRRFEFDMGWAWIRLFEKLHLAKVNKVPPRPVFAEDKTSIDIDTLRSLMQNRFQVMARYRREVIVPVFQEEKARASEATRAFFRRASTLLHREDTLINESSREKLGRLMSESETLAAIYQFRLRLQDIWSRTSQNSHEMVEALRAWCAEAEASGIRSLEEFSAKLKAYTMAPGVA